LPLQVKGNGYETPDGTCVRDYIDVTDLVDAHVKELNKAQRGRVGIYNVGTGKGHISSEYQCSSCLIRKPKKQNTTLSIS
jgi:UDP-arabinose 4-epimerase